MSVFSLHVINSSCVISNYEVVKKQFGSNYCINDLKAVQTHKHAANLFPCVGSNFPPEAKAKREKEG